MHPLVERILQGDTRSVARLLRSIDDRAGTYLQALAELFPHTGRAEIIGITGNPGAGKSTLTDQLIAHYRRADKKVGVVAVDPTSPFSGGAILGDRIRMQRHALDEKVFIRSLATRGHLGGVSRSTADSVHVLDAWGADVVLIETVGVGQDELEVARIAQTTIVVVPPGLGDEIQAIKAGILEVADVFCVNKADREGADATVRDLETMIGMSHEIFHSQMRGGAHHGVKRLDLNAAREAIGDEEWLTPIVKTIAMRGEGIAELAAAVEKHRAFLFTTKRGERRREERAREELLSVLNATALEALASEMRAEIDGGVAKVLARERDPYSLAADLVRRFRGGREPA
jgi:LAO/AO transport system kinase